MTDRPAGTDQARYLAWLLGDWYLHGPKSLPSGTDWCLVFAEWLIDRGVHIESATPPKAPAHNETFMDAAMREVNAILESADDA